MAQKMKVESMLSTIDQTANLAENLHKDNNGEYGGLVKVKIASASAEFDGWILEQKKYKPSEFWVFMAKGSRHISVYAEGYLPLEVRFSDFGIEGLFYFTPPAPPEEEEGEETEAVEEAPEAAAEANPFEKSMVTEETEAAPVEEELGEPKYNPVTGDKIHFDLVLGGDAKTAVIFSENDSVLVSQQDYT